MGEATLQPLEDAFLSLENREMCLAFLKDLCTPAEIKAMEERWRVCQLLTAGHPYTYIHEQTGVSITTIGRVARFLHHEPHGGYRAVLQHFHSPRGEN